MGIKMKKKKLSLPIPLPEFVVLAKEAGLTFLPTDEEIWMRAAHLDWEHRDPVDRAIVATAQKKDLPLLTEDRAIREFYAGAVW